MPSYTSDPKGESREDRKARIARHHADAVALLAKQENPETEGFDATIGAYVQPELVMGAGVVTPPGQRRFSRAYASMRAGKGTWAMVTVQDAHRPPETLSQLGCIGWAESPFGAADTEALRQAAMAGKATLTVWTPEDGLRILPVSHYQRIRRERRAAAKAAVTVNPAERQAMQDARLMAGMGTIHDDAA